MKISLLQWLLYVLSALYCSPFELRSTFNILRRRYFFLAAQKATMCISDWNEIVHSVEKPFNKRIDGIGCRLKMSEDLHDKVF